jgi:hypothetical protein
LLRHNPWCRSIPNLAALTPHALIVIGLPALAFDLDFKEAPFGPATLGIAFLLVLIGWVALFLHWVLVGLRADLVSASSAAEGQSWLSTQPDAATYVPSAYAGRVLDYIERANSGVIGVTGVRGAGKSALFKHVLQQCAGRFGRLEMTAPVAYERGTQSLMTLCRELAQRVIRDVEPALHGRPSTAVLAMRDLARRVPALLVLTLIVVILVGYGATRTYETYFNVQGSVISDTPFAFDQSYPQAVRIWPTNQIVREPPRFRETLTGLRDAESSVIEHVVADARRVLRLMQVKDERSSTNFIIGALLSPAATSGFTFAPVSTEILPPGLSMLAASWSLNAELVSQQALDLVGINFIREFYSA